MAKEIEFLIL